LVPRESSRLLTGELQRAHDERAAVDHADDLRAKRLRALRWRPSTAWSSARTRERVAGAAVAVSVESVRVRRPSSFVEVLGLGLVREVGAVAILTVRWSSHHNNGDGCQNQESA
jgi:hypothetical protein